MKKKLPQVKLIKKDLLDFFSISLSANLNLYAFEKYDSATFKNLLKSTNKYNPINRIVNLLGMVVGSTVFTSVNSNTILLKTSKTMLDLFYTQHVKDPWQYTSHDFTHSCRTQDILRNLFKSIKEFRFALGDHFKKVGMAMSSTNEYCSAQRIGQFCSEITCLLHDIGYPAQQDRGFQKSNHTIEGMRLIETLLEHDFIKLFCSIGLTLNQSKFLINEVKKAVLCHGADKVEDSRHFTHELDCGCAKMWIQKKDVKQMLQMPFFLKQFSIKPSVSSRDVRFADAYYLNDNKLGIKFEPVDLMKDPINASIRFCDNLDTSVYRLRHDQKLFADKALKLITEKFNGLDKPILLETKDNSCEFVSNYYALDCPVFNYQIKQLKYFLGLYPIESVSFKFSEINNTLKVIFNMNKYYCELGSILVLDELNQQIKLVDFYFNRVKDSLKSITFNNNQILFEKKVIN